MGESLVETPSVETKMDESVKSVPRLDVSVSFGRFENDALSWEKWSSFSPNKYLEEVGTLSTPGSVAQKKAYFEAHYKRIAAKKAEELEQEKLVNAVTPNQDKSFDQNHVENPTKDESCTENHVENSFEIDTKLGKKEFFEAHYRKVAAKRAEELEKEQLMSENHVEYTFQSDSNFDLSNGERLVEENSTNLTVSDEAKDGSSRSSEEDGACSNGFLETMPSQEKEDGSVSVECASFELEKIKNELNGNLVDNPELNVKEDAVLEVETPREIVEKPQERKSVMLQASVSKKGNSKINGRNIAQKVTPTKKDKNTASTKKVVISPAVKPSHTSTLKYSKSTSISTPIFSSHSSKKKVNGSILPQTKKLESKRGAGPTSLHMSFSLDSGNSSTVTPMNRKSLIMESMGDKDIVKRAFKSFQNRTFAADEKSTSVSTSASGFSTPLAARKRNEGPKKDVEKLATQSSQSATRSRPLSSGDRLHKSSPLDRKNTMAASPSTTGLRSDERAERRKEFLKNLEAKSIAREAENAQRSEKTKEAKEAEMKKLRQSLNFKAKPLPSFYRGQGKWDLEKDGVGNGIHRRNKLNQ